MQLFPLDTYADAFFTMEPMDHDKAVCMQEKLDTYSWDRGTQVGFRQSGRNIQMSLLNSNVVRTSEYPSNW